MGASDLPRRGLRADQREFLLGTARQSMEAAVRKRRFSSPGTRDNTLLRPAGAFTTLTVSGELRGCVGFIEPADSLVETVARSAAKAALEDHRFLPVTEAELDSIRIELSVLSGRLPVRSQDDIVIGRDGLVLETPSARGLLLPQVASSNGWDVPTFIANLFRKCGLPVSSIDAPGISVFRFTAEVFSETGAPGESGSSRHDVPS